MNADIVYVGYGIEAPEYKWNDYKGVDVKGKVLLMLVNEPTSDDPNFFKGKALTYYGRWTYKYEEAARKGAVGVILIHKTDMASYGWDVVRNSWSGEQSYLQLDGPPKLKVASWIQLDMASKLAQRRHGSRQDDGRGAIPGFHPVASAGEVEGAHGQPVRPFDSNNVLAMLPGSDPKLKNQAVIYSAHYDHLGIRPDMPATTSITEPTIMRPGCGILLEMARAFSLSAQKPEALDFLRVGYGRGARTARLGVSGQASADSRGKDLRWILILTMSRRWVFRKKSKSPAQSAQRFIPWWKRRRRISECRFVPIPTRSRVLLSLRSFQLGARGHSRFFR